MTIYRWIANQCATVEAQELAERLTVWHDDMVRHERSRERTRGGCDDECPHADAGVLWDEAVRTFGRQADELRFLRSRGRGGDRARTRPAVEAAR